MSEITERVVTATARSPKDKPPVVFGHRLSWGESVTVYDVDGHVFPTRQAAEAFTNQNYPRTLPNGRFVTSETPPRIFRNQERALDRQRAVSGGVIE